MTADDKIPTLHPQGKKGVNISRQKYDVVRSTIADCLRRGEELTHAELAGCVRAKLDARFEASIDWYVESIKLDLEARRVIERTDSKPQRYRLAG